MVIEVTNRAVSENKTDIKPNQGTAPAKYEPHEPTDGTVFLDTVAIVNPNQRQVLHVVKHFEECDSGENIRDAVVAVPPKRDARDKKREFHRILPRSGDPHSNVICNPKSRHRHRRKEEGLLKSVDPNRRNKRQTASVKPF